MRIWPNTPCPTCKAGPREMCRTTGGIRLRKPHTTRPIGNIGGIAKPITRQIDTLGWEE